MPSGVYARTKFVTKEYCRGRTVEQFWMRVDKKGPIHKTLGRCWVWIAGKDQGGYGYYGNKRAHRIAYELEVGEIPKGLHILHHCDNPECVNPKHLYAGTPQNNMDDKYARGRQGKSGTKTPPIGVKNPKAKLTEEQVLMIRKRRDEGLKAREILIELKLEVDVASVHNVINGNTWKHLS